MSGPPRRQWLRSVAACGLLPAAAAAAAVPWREQGYAFLGKDDVAFLAAAADRMIPRDEFPSASEAGVVVYIDRQLAGDFGRGARMYLAGPVRKGTPQQGYQLGLPPATVYRESLNALLAAQEGRDFAAGPPAQQDQFLRELEAGAWMLGRVPSSVFFETLLANVVEGYFADPSYGGNRDMAGWKMIGFPGAYANFVHWVGRHNVRFNRPPVGIGSPRMPHAGDHGHEGDHRVPASARPAERSRR